MRGRLGRESHCRGGKRASQNQKDNARREREKTEGETEVTRSKLMHGQLSESRRQRKTEIIYEHE